jgi:hypothetical protein
LVVVVAKTLVVLTQHLIHKLLSVVVEVEHLVREQQVLQVVQVVEEEEVLSEGQERLVKEMMVEKEQTKQALVVVVVQGLLEHNYMVV